MRGYETGNIWRYYWVSIKFVGNIYFWSIILGICLSVKLWKQNIHFYSQILVSFACFTFEKHTEFRQKSTQEEKVPTVSRCSLCPFAHRRRWPPHGLICPTGLWLGQNEISSAARDWAPWMEGSAEGGTASRKKQDFFQWVAELAIFSHCGQISGPLWIVKCVLLHNLVTGFF